MSVFSISMLSAALFEVPTGIFSDMIGRKNTVVLGAFFAVLFAIFYAIGGNYLFLVIGAVLEGVSRSFYSGNNEALLYESLSSQNKEHTFHHILGKVSSANQAALAISSVFGALLVMKSFSLLFWISVVSQIICLLISLFLVEPRVHSKKSGNIYEHLREAFLFLLHNKKLRILAIGDMLSSGTGEAMFQFQSAFFATLWPLWAVGLAKTYAYIAATIGFFFGGKVVAKLSPLKALLLGTIVNRIEYFAGVLFPNPISPILLSSNSFQYGINNTAKSTLFQQEFTQHQRATLGSLTSFMGSIWFAAIALVLGFIGDRMGVIAALIFGNSILCVNVVLYWRLENDFRKKG